MSSRYLALSAVTLVLMVLGTLPVSASPAPTSPQTLEWGIYHVSYPADASGIAKLNAEVGRQASIVHWYSEAGRRGAMDTWSVNKDFVQAQLRAGVTPMITWEFWNGRNDGTNSFPLVDIAAGRFDRYIDSWAQGIAGVAPGVVYLRVFHEMNDAYEPSQGMGYPWSIVDGNSFGNSPSDLVAAWRHIHDRFVRAGATNVRWIFNADGDLEWHPLPTEAYPGDDVVDFIGWDAYEGNSTSVLSDYSHMDAFNRTKPMLLGEMGATSPTFVQELSTGLRSGQMPRMSALLWWNEADYSLESQPSVRSAVAALLATSTASTASAATAISSAGVPRPGASSVPPALARSARATHP